MPLAQIAPPHPTPPLPIYPASVAFAPFHNLYPPTHWMSLCFDRLFVSLPYRTSTPLLSTFSLPCFYPLPSPSPSPSPVVLSRLRFTVSVCSPFPHTSRKPNSNISRYGYVLGYLRVTFETHPPISIVWSIEWWNSEFSARREEKIPRNTKLLLRTRCVAHILTEIAF